ncbi:MAG: DUF4058 family protein [bacterium]|nr:DUF4058 family protein [bacterium]
MRQGFTDAEITHLEQGPFVGRIDLWSETGRYFKTIHTEMIGLLIEKIDRPLLQLGYVAIRESSIQIAEGREPDVQVWLGGRQAEKPAAWDYELAAAESLAATGVLVQDAPDLEALYIREQNTGELVTVLEIVSPGNKSDMHEIASYQARRSRLFLEWGVHLVEMDLTRSVKRLTQNSVTRWYPYHVAVFLADATLRVIGVELDQPLPRVALPLRGEVIAVELQEIYERAYRKAKTAWRIQQDGAYGEANLPFPSTLTDDQRRDALDAVARWQAKAEQLRLSR